MNSKRWIAAGLLCALTFLACDRGQGPSPDRKSLVTEHALVAAHTVGTISTASPIRVRFAEDMVDATHFNAPLPVSPLRFEPEIRGMAVWTQSNELEFRPSKRLPAGQSYEGTLDLAAIATTDTSATNFVFKFSTLQQSFDVTIVGFSPVDPTQPELWALEGAVQTVDSAPLAAVEKVMRAIHAGQSLDITWSQNQDETRHTFKIAGVVRQADETQLRLSWDGSPLGVDKRSDTTIAVAGLDDFTVSKLRTIDTEERYLEIEFTDVLAKDQDLTGLIRVEGENELRFVIEANTIRVYKPTHWSGSQRVIVEPSVKNSRNRPLDVRWETEVSFAPIAPLVRFAGEGVVLPTTQGLTIPIEAVNLHAIVVEALQVFEENIPQFLQVNDLDERREMQRVGRVVWRETIALDTTPEQENRWVRYGLDLNPLIKNHPKGIYQLQLSFRRNHIIYDCPDLPGSQDDMFQEGEITNLDEEEETSNWDWWVNNSGTGGYNNRKDPCSAAYYQSYYDHDITVRRNVLLSDIGLLAKAGQDGAFLIIATDIRTAKPLAGVEISLLDYQQQPLTSGLTDPAGIVKLHTSRKPYLAMARHGSQHGYLKLNDGAALSVAHFDVAGAKVSQGLRGFLYGERGVWRPGDTIHLGFILFDSDERLPQDHPVHFEITNSRGQLLERQVRTASLHGFYRFDVHTDPDAPSGNYRAKVRVGGATFHKTLKVETIMPNRLKIEMDLEEEMLRAPNAKLSGTLTATWLHGAIAKNLDSDVEVTLRPQPTRFPKYPAHTFDDPTRSYRPESQPLFKGKLDATGKTELKARIHVPDRAPGMLVAQLRTRVFEPGGAFSVDQFRVPVSPYRQYVGVSTPKGDVKRGMLLTDVVHPVDVVLLDPDGAPVDSGEVTVKLYKIAWRWWWEKGKEDLATYSRSRSFTAIQSDTIAVRDGHGTWNMEIKYPAWGRYLILATDKKGGHQTGRIIYVDWPGWAGRAQKDSPGGATVLTFAADKEEYEVGETVVLSLPKAENARGLVSIESATKVVQTEWVAGESEPTQYSFTATAAMAPNVYAHVTFLQPHLQAKNDLPIRMYGVIPIKVVDPTTRLTPVVTAQEVFAPEQPAQIAISEASGRPMTYTLAVVDEGLLGLTRYETPDPWSHFYQREALGVRTWDLFDDVAGAHGAALERLLAIGGGGDGEEELEDQGAKRFPPMVRYLGPFALAAGAKNQHDVDIPQYLGAVRVMVVAGQKGAFGSAGKSVFVRKPLMVLATLPRVLGPGEEVELPISVFALEDKVKNVEVAITTSGPISVDGAKTKKLKFDEPSDKLVRFALTCPAELGVASVEVTATGAGERSTQTIELDVRMPAPSVTRVVGTELEAGETWDTRFDLVGLQGTNEAVLEVSRIPSLDLSRRLDYLVRFPHGCVEQVTSAVFAQLFLDRFMDLSPGVQAEITKNIKAGIERLASFQTSDGGFSYWPASSGGWSSPENFQPNDWGSSYAGHFLVAAQRVGYAVPGTLLERWKAFQRRQLNLSPANGDRSDFKQAYRLYTLALAGAPELGAMNRLRESTRISSQAQWRLAATYDLAGRPAPARNLVQKASMKFTPYNELSGTYGSDLRDKAMVLETLLLLEMLQQAKPLADDIAAALSGDASLSTQTTAYSLIAMAQYAGGLTGDEDMRYAFDWNGDREQIASRKPVVKRDVAVRDGQSQSLKLTNDGSMPIFPRVVLSGVPPLGAEEPAENGMWISVEYENIEGEVIDPSEIEQGVDFRAVVTVRNTGNRGSYEELALTQIFPAGWEIRNERFEEGPNEEGRSAQQTETASAFDFRDIRDDRVYTYFDLKQGETKVFEVLLNASYVGRYYLPLVAVEAMYDHTINARTAGQWVQVVRQKPVSSGG